MRAVSSPRFLLDLPRWLPVVVALVAILAWVLLVFATGVTGNDPVTPADGTLFGPFRWDASEGMA